MLSHYSTNTWGYFYIESGELIGHDSCDVMAWASAHPDYAGSIMFDYGNDEPQTECRGTFYPEDEDVEAMIHAARRDRRRVRQSPHRCSGKGCVMACDCISLMNAKLAERNTKLSLGLVIRENKMEACIYIGTELIEKKRGSRPVGAIATFCPFCGAAYEPKAVRAAVEGEPMGEVA